MGSIVNKLVSLLGYLELNSLTRTQYSIGFKNGRCKRVLTCFCCRERGGYGLGFGVEQWQQTQ